MQSLKYKNLSAEHLQIQCSNGYATKTCKQNLVIVPDKQIQPMWIYPNTTYFYECLTIKNVRNSFWSFLSLFFIINLIFIEKGFNGQFFDYTNTSIFSG